MLGSLVVAETVAQRLVDLGDGRQQPIMSGPPASHFLETLDHVQLGAVAGQRRDFQRRKCCKNRVNRGSLMPGRVVNDQHDPGLLRRGIHEDDGAQVVGTGLLQVAPFREPSLLRPQRTLDQARRQLASHDIQCPEEIERGMSIKVADERTVALYAQWSP